MYKSTILRILDQKFDQVSIIVAKSCHRMNKFVFFGVVINFCEPKVFKGLVQNGLPQNGWS